MPFQVSNTDDLTGIRLTTARYYTPSGESIQGKGITPDIIIEQGEFESFEYKRFSEADLKDSLDNGNDETENNQQDIEEEPSTSPKHSAKDLEIKLKKAVEKEEYEEAAKIRDKLKELDS